MKNKQIYVERNDAGKYAANSAARRKPAPFSRPRRPRSTRHAGCIRARRSTSNASATPRSAVEISGEIYSTDCIANLETGVLRGRLLSFPRLLSVDEAETNAFARLAKKAGIGTTSLHSTRHTAATHLIAGGIDVTTTAAILGHSTPTVTVSIYSHVVEGYRMATAADPAKKKARVTGLEVVAGTGFESVKAVFSRMAA